jgi:hypothetical protein
MAAQQDAVAMAGAATTTRVNALKEYAAQVTQADAARRDWENAHEIASRNDAYQALVARTAADEHAVADLVDLAAQSSALQTVLADASLAAEVLVLRREGEPASQLPVRRSPGNPWCRRPASGWAVRQTRARRRRSRRNVQPLGVTLKTS